MVNFSTSIVLYSLSLSLNKFQFGISPGKLEDGFQVDMNEKLEFTIGDNDVIQVRVVLTDVSHLGYILRTFFSIAVSHYLTKFFATMYAFLQAFEIIARLLQVGEVVEFKTDPRFAYGKLGRTPDIPPDAHIHYVMALLEIKPPLEYEKMPPLVRLLVVGCGRELLQQCIFIPG